MGWIKRNLPDNGGSNDEPRKCPCGSPMGSNGDCTRKECWNRSDADNYGSRRKD